MAEKDLTQERINLGTGPLGVTGEQIVEQTKDLPTGPDPLRPRVDFSQMSEEEIANEFFSTDDIEETRAIQNIVRNSDYFLSPLKKDGTPIPGARRPDGLIDPGFASKVPYANPQNKFRTLMENDGGVVGVAVDAENEGQPGVVRVGNKFYRQHTLPSLDAYRKAIGYTVDEAGNPVAPEPIQNSLTSFWYTVDRKDKVAEFTESMKDMNIPTRERTALAEAYVDGSLMRARRGAAVTDFGKMVVNIAIAAHNGALTRTVGPLGVTAEDITRFARGEKELTDDMLQDGVVNAVLQQGAKDILKATVNDNPEEQDKISGTGKLRIEYFDYAADILAENMNIKPEQASKILNNAAADVFDKLSIIALETIPFALGEYGYVVARGSSLFNKGFKPYVSSKYGTKSYEEAIERASAEGTDVAKLMYDFANYEIMNGSGFLGYKRLVRKSAFAREAMATRIQDLVAVGSAASAQGRALAYNAASDLSNKYYSSYLENRAQGNFIKAGKDWLNSEKALVSGAVPKVLLDLAGDETWAAFGAASTSHLFHEYFGADNSAFGEFAGAMLGVTMMPIAGGKLAKVTKMGVYDIPVGVFVGMKGGDGFKESLKRSVKTSPAAKTAYDLIYKGTSPEYQKMIEDSIASYGQLEQRVLQIRGADGEALFEEGEIMTLLGDITGLQVLQDMTDYIDGRTSTMDIVNGSGAALERENVIQMRQQLRKRVAESLNKLRPIERELTDEGAVESARIIQGMRNMNESLSERLNRDIDVANQAATDLDTALNDLIQFGEVEGVTVVDATKIIKERQRRILTKFTNEDGVLEDLDGALAELAGEAQRIKSEFGENSRLASKLETLSSGSGAGTSLSANAKALRQSYLVERDMLYEQFNQAAPEARMDIFDLYEDIDTDVALTYLNEGIALDSPQGLDAATKQAMKMGDVKLGQEKYYRVMFNYNAVDFFRESPRMNQLLGLSPDSDIQDVYDATSGIVAAVSDALGETAGPAPIDHLFYLKNVFRKAAKDDSYREKVSGIIGDVSVEQVEALADSFILPASPMQFKYLMQALTPAKADKQKELIQINLRKRAMEMAENPDTGFKMNIYEPDAEFIGEELIGKLRKANAFNREFKQRYAKGTKASRIIESGPGKPLKSALAADEIFKDVNKYAKRGDVAEVIDEDIGDELARLVGGHYDPATDRFYLIEGSDAAELAKDIVKQHVNRKWMLSGPGRELVNRAERGNLPLGTVISSDGVKRLKNLQTLSGPEEFISDSDLPDYITALQRIPTYKLDDAGAIIKGDTTELLSAGEVVEAVDFDLWSGVNLPKGQRISVYGDVVRGTVQRQKAAIQQVRRTIQAQAEKRKEIQKGIGDIISSGTKTLGPGTRATLYQAATNDVGLRKLKEYRLSLDEEGVKIFNQEMADNLAHTIALQARTKGNDIDINKLESLLDTPGVNAAIEEFGGSQAVQNYRDLIELSRRTFDRPKSTRFIGTPQPYGLDAELNKIWAVSQGRGSLRWFGLQLLVRQGRQMDLQAFRSMLADPEVGRELINIIKEGRRPNTQRVSRIFDTMLVYTARDIALYGEEGTTFGLAKRKIFGGDMRAEEEMEARLGQSPFDPESAEPIQYGVKSYRTELEKTMNMRKGIR